MLLPVVSGACTANPTAPPTSPAHLRPVQELQLALLHPPGLPDGLAVAAMQSSVTTASSADPHCAALATIFNTPTAVGSLQHVEERLSGGDHGPFVDENIDQMAGLDGVTAEQTQLKTALAQCATLTIADPGQAGSTMTVTTGTAPQAGQDPVAFTSDVTSGPQAGFTFTIVATGVADTILTLGFVSTPPGQIDDITKAAVDQAAHTLNAAATTS